MLRAKFKDNQTSVFEEYIGVAAKFGHVACNFCKLSANSASVLTDPVHVLNKIMKSLF